MSNNRNKLLAKMLNSMQFFQNGELSKSKIHALNISSEIRFSDFNEKILSKLVSGEVIAISLTECHSYGYVPNSPIRPLKKEEIDEFISDGENLGELGDSPIMTFGREIRAEDIPDIGIGGLDIKIYQDVTELIVMIINKWMNDQQWQESHNEECAERGLVDPCLNYNFGSWGQTFVTHEILWEEMGILCHVVNGGVEGETIIGYSIGSEEFGITNEYFMSLDDWSVKFYFVNAKN
jgi:hypothetical protein